ncbi:MAG TPA: thiamine pyrophosphate-dependent enzyme [Pirellulales bacterium]|nr:thiamine pyrophosphate-dependent enzyme [Pirellulales bacterium]
MHCVAEPNWLSLYRAMATARAIDRVEAELVRRGEAFFHVSGAGHEAVAALAAHLTEHDWLHCHYRDKALLIARGVGPREFFASLLCRDESHSRGRQLGPFLSDRNLKILSMAGPVATNTLEAVGIAAEVLHHVERPIVVCSVGDGTTQQGEFLEALAEAVRERLPVLFLIEDNRWSISTRTPGRTCYSLPDGPAAEFYGIPIDRLDGRDPLAAGERFGEVVRRLRDERQPAIVWLEVERLCDHTNADDQTLYRDASEIEAARADADPLRVFADRLSALGVEAATLRGIDAEVARAVALAAEQALADPDPQAVFTAKAPLAPLSISVAGAERSGAPKTQSPGHRSGSAGSAWAAQNWAAGDNGHSTTMGEAIRATLRHHLSSDDRVVLFGEDIEDPKGDVFGVTRGLSSEFAGRVRNSPLAEATILGVSIGRALAGARPVAFLQFADFLPLAYNQIHCELGSLYWRTDGAWQAPVIVMIACGGYRPGLGPFHAQTFESIAAHTPGIDVVMPSTAADAAGLLDAAFASGRPTLFFYPKARLNIADDPTSAGVPEQWVSLGKARLARHGDALTFVSWGNTLAHCRQTADALATVGMETDVIDLRSLSPWDETAVLASVERTGRLVVVHEDNHTCGFGAEVVATVAEKSRVPVAVRRVTRPDTFVPCHFGNQLEVLPCFRRVLAAAAELLDLDLAWQEESVEEAGLFTIDAIGSGPSDEAVLVTDVLVAPGARVQVGDVVAIAEAAKAAIDICSTVAGTVSEVLAAPGETVAVGRPLIRLRTAGGQRPKPITRERPGTPILTRRNGHAAEGRRAGGVSP